MKALRLVLIILLLGSFFYLVWHNAPGIRDDKKSVELEQENPLVREWNFFNEPPPVSIINKLEEEGFPVEEFPLPGIMSLTAVNCGENVLEVIFSVRASPQVEQQWDHDKNWNSLLKRWYLYALGKQGWNYSTPFAGGKEATISVDRKDTIVEMQLKETYPRYSEVILKVKEAEKEK